MQSMKQSNFNKICLTKNINSELMKTIEEYLVLQKRKMNHKKNLNQDQLKVADKEMVLHILRKKVQVKKNQAASQEVNPNQDQIQKNRQVKKKRKTKTNLMKNIIVRRKRVKFNREALQME